MNNMTGAEKAKEIRNSIFAILIAAVFLFPIYWLIQISFKSDAETFGKVLTYFPHEFTFEPWLENLTDKTFLISLKNFIIITLTNSDYPVRLSPSYHMARGKASAGAAALFSKL